MISQNYDITSTRQLVVAGENQNRTVYLQIVGNSTVYVGGSGVTSSLGVPYEKHSSPHTVFVPINEEIYAVCADGVTESLRVLTPRLD
jgi:serine/threonine protein phosphatase PrpC